MEQTALMDVNDHEPNPLVRHFGRGPADRRCKTCSHLLRLRYHDNTYIKCKLRPMTHGAGTDHRVNWASCAKYEEKP